MHCCEALVVRPSIGLTSVRWVTCGERTSTIASPTTTRATSRTSLLDDARAAAVETLQLAGKIVHSVAGGALLICLERGLSVEVIRAIGERSPERVVCLDEGFAGNDQLKANAVQTFKTKGVTAFRTV